MKLIIISLLGIVAVCHGGSHKAEYDDCDVCTEDFTGFGTPASKCGCCPWPCCCKCFNTTLLSSGPCVRLLDLAFIVEASGAISEQDWEVAKTFVRDIVGIFHAIGKNEKVAMVTYSTNATLNWNFGDPETSSAAALEKAIMDLQLLGKLRNTVEGMEVAVEQIFGGKDDRPDVPNIVILITYGKANFRIAELPAMARRLQDEALVVVVGVTSDVDDTELEIIASSPDLVLRVFDFDALITILASYEVQICVESQMKEKCFCCCSPEQFFGGGGAYYYSRH